MRLTSRKGESISKYVISLIGMSINGIGTSYLLLPRLG